MNWPDKIDIYRTCKILGSVPISGVARSLVLLECDVHRRVQHKQIRYFFGETGPFLC